MKSKMKKTLAVILAIMMLFITSCNTSSEPNTDSTPTECEHIWENATCTTPKTCSSCKATEGEALGHSWVEATCSAPKTCSACKATEGEALGHSWLEATCSAPKTCSVCKKSQGGLADHYDSGDGKCKYCKQDILLLELKEGFDIQMIIPSVGTLNSYCTFKFTNHTKYNIINDMEYISANGKLLHHPEPNFTLEPGYYVTITHYVDSFYHSTSSKYQTLYLDNNSLGYTHVYVNGKRVFVRFGVNGATAFGYSLAEIGVY